MKSKADMIILLILIVSVIVCSVSFFSAHAEINLKLAPITGPVTGKGLDTLVSISLSRSSLAITTINNTDYPSYELLYKNGLDNSVIQSGSFDYVNGIFQRVPTNIKNEEQLYAFTTNKLILDPSHRMQIKTKTIHIVPSLDAFILKSELQKINDTRIIYKDISISNDCKSATMTSTNWLSLLPKLIYFLRSNCNEDLKLFETFDIIKDNVTEIDITTTANYQYQQWLKEAKEKSKTEFLIK